MTSHYKRRCCRYSWRCQAITVVICGIILSVIGGVLFPVLDMIIHKQVEQNVVLKPGTITYKQFKEPTVPIYMQFYMFNVSNPYEVQKEGHRPVVTQKGPYSYREQRIKYNMTENDNGTVTYKQLKVYHFDKDTSCKTCDPYKDHVTTVNLVLLTLFEALKRQPKTFNAILTVLLPLVKETLFMTRSVNETIWGYHDPVLKLAHSLPIINQWFYSDFLGVFYNKNNTDDGLYTVFTGTENINFLGDINRYNGSDSVTFWNSTWANMVNGSDGTLCPPFINKTVILPMFSTDVCRSLYGTYSESSHTKNGDIATYLFTGTHAELASVKENPDNIGFCSRMAGCLPTGVLDISTCQMFDYFHVPVVVSFPHFYMADQEIIDDIVGMNPNEIEHRTEIGVEPLTGIIMHIAKRLQINMLLERVPGVSMTQKLKGRFIFPVLWVNESMDITQEVADDFHRLVTVPLTVSYVAKYGLLGFGGFLILTGLIYAMCQQYKDKRGNILDVPVRTNNSQETDGEDDEQRRLIQPFQ